MNSLSFSYTCIKCSRGCFLHKGIDGSVIDLYHTFQYYPHSGAIKCKIIHLYYKYILNRFPTHLIKNNRISYYSFGNSTINGATVLTPPIEVKPTKTA